MNAAATFAAGVERWHDFYLLAGTAAATLMGLLFVSLSLHLEVLGGDRKAHLSVIAREAFANFLIVLLIALLMLSHTMSQRSLGVSLLMIGVLRVAQVGLRFSRPSAPAPRERKPGRAYVLVRFAMPILGYLALMIGGWTALRGSLDDALDLIMVSCVLLIGDAARCAWDLLVRVGRIAHPEASN
jgi:hypothetical protein